MCGPASALKALPPLQVRALRQEAAVQLGVEVQAVLAVLAARADLAARQAAEEVPLHPLFSSLMVWC